MKTGWSSIWRVLTVLVALGLIDISLALAQPNAISRFPEIPYEEFEARIVQSYLSIAGQEDKAWSGEPVEISRPGRNPSQENVDRYRRGTHATKFLGLGECLNAVLFFIAGTERVSQLDEDRSVRRYDYQALYRRLGNTDFGNSDKDAHIQAAMNRYFRDYVKRADACDVWRTGKPGSSHFRDKHR